MHSVERFPPVRKHTLCFIDYAKQNAAVAISAEIDMSSIVNFRNKMKSSEKISYISFIVYAVSRVVEKNPMTNSIYRSGFFPQIINYKEIHAKFTLDKVVDNKHIVASAIIKNSNKLKIDEIQQAVNYFKRSDFYSIKDFLSIRILHKLPLWLGKFLFRTAMRNPKKAQEVQGSFTITSLGHHPVDSFIPISGSTLTFGVGCVRDKATVYDDLVTIKPMMTLTMMFDHRVIDGALASNILTEVKEVLETF